jgi:hypothetical protein
MATLTKCPFCDATMPKVAARSPSCGAMVRPLLGPVEVVVILVLMVALVIAAWNLS